MLRMDCFYPACRTFHATHSGPRHLNNDARV
jgi:hypothetical protein